MRDELIDIGGRRLHFVGAGADRPAVVLEAGLGDTAATWHQVWPALAAITTVGSYDRAGQGPSDPAPLPRTVGGMADDLAALLAAAGVPAPYLLVGHSFGAQVVRLFAARHPAQVAGLVLIDPSHEDKYARFEAVLSADLVARQNAYLADPTRNAEGIDLPRSRAEMQAAPPPPAVPLVILSRGRPDAPSSVWPSAAIQQIEWALHRELLDAAPASYRRLILAEQSGHFIHQDQPDLVTTAIRDLVAGIRNQS